MQMDQKCVCEKRAAEGGKKPEKVFYGSRVLLASSGPPHRVRPCAAQCAGEKLSSVVVPPNTKRRLGPFSGQNTLSITVPPSDYGIHTSAP